MLWKFGEGIVLKNVGLGSEIRFYSAGQISLHEGLHIITDYPLIPKEVE